MVIGVKIVRKHGKGFRKIKKNRSVIPTTPIINCSEILYPALFQHIQTGAPLSCFKHLPNASFDVAATQCANLRTNTTTQKSRFAWIQNVETFTFLTSLITVLESNRNKL